jgi:predicted secreted protein
MTPAMGWATGLAIYATIWWVVIFAVLPWGARPPETIERGHAPSAPDRPMIGRKALVTTVISTVIWVAIEMVVRSELVSFRDMAAR